MSRKCSSIVSIPADLHVLLKTVVQRVYDFTTKAPLLPLTTLLQHNQGGWVQQWKESHQAETANSNSTEQIELRIQFHGQISSVSQTC